MSEELKAEIEMAIQFHDCNIKRKTEPLLSNIMEIIQRYNTWNTRTPDINTEMLEALEGDVKLFERIWYNRNPSHEINDDTLEDMFWSTAEHIAREYVKELNIQKTKGLEK